MDSKYRPSSTLHGLSDKYLYRAASPRMDLIVYHVLQTLIVCGSDKYLGIDLPTGVAVVHDFVASQLVAVFL